MPTRLTERQEDMKNVLKSQGNFAKKFKECLYFRNISFDHWILAPLLCHTIRVIELGKIGAIQQVTKKEISAVRKKRLG